jgi:hypothetical protein
MDFSEALTKVRERHRIRRGTWPRSHYVVAQDGYPDGIKINGNTARATGEPEGTVMPFRPYLMRYRVYEGFSPWTPDQLDLFADDWEATPVDREPKLSAGAFG